MQRFRKLDSKDLGSWDLGMKMTVGNRRSQINFHSPGKIFRFLKVTGLSEVIVGERPQPILYDCIICYIVLYYSILYCYIYIYIHTHVIMSIEENSVIYIHLSKIIYYDSIMLCYLTLPR